MLGPCLVAIVAALVLTFLFGRRRKAPRPSPDSRDQMLQTTILPDAAEMERKCNSSLEIGSTSNDTTGALHDVFLSFRGPDTRMTFTDTLYYALLNKGIRVFIDKKGIDVGDEIGPEIYQAIDDSKVCIPIFSMGYASSRWCLRELEHMMKRRKTHKLEVMPIFYDVDPSVVKLETGVYRDALTQHKRERENETVKGWEEALKEVTKIKGWDAKNTGHGELTQQIALEVLGKLEVSPIRLSDPLIGINKSVDKVIELLNVKSKDIKLVGICGIGGIGKTTLAKVVYKKLSTDFQSCSFIHDIRQASESSSFGLLDVQRQLVCDILGDKRIEIRSIDQGRNMIEKQFSKKKVLIILDDINDGRQLRVLAAEEKWFGSGSRILVTTRDKQVLSVFKNSLIYEVEGLNSQESLELFSKHAFGSNFDFPPSDFLHLSEKAIARAGGLPLTIEVIGSLLCGQEEAVWEDTLEKMEKYPCEDVLQHLMLSYEALNHGQKQIFLDVACFLAGKNERDSTYMWEDRKWFPIVEIKVLLQRSLLKIEKKKNELWMDVQLRGLGTGHLFDEKYDNPIYHSLYATYIWDNRKNDPSVVGRFHVSPLEIGKKNELWMHDQLKDLGRSIVLAENYNNPGNRSRVWDHKDALDMITRKKGTETIEAICVDFEGKSLKSEEFKNMPNIRYLEMTSGNLSKDFKDVFRELRWLSWKNCPSSLQATHFFPKELLILDLSRTGITHHWNGWTQLKVATRLKVLNLSNCKMLKETPDLSAFSSLEILILEGCGKLTKLPNSIGMLQCLVELDVSFTSIEELPNTIFDLKSLKMLKMNNSHMKLSNSIGMLQCLVELDVSFTSIEELPNTIVDLKSLKILKMNYSHMRKLPEGIVKMEKLEEIHGNYCRALEIPGDIVRLSSLKILELKETCVKNVPELPPSLVSLCLTSGAVQNFPDIFNLMNRSSLKKMYIIFGEGDDGICVELDLPYRPISNNSLRMSLPSSEISFGGWLRCTRELILLECKNLRQIQQFPSGLRKLAISNCYLLEVVDLSRLENLLELRLIALEICDIRGLEALASLQRLQVCECKSFKFSGLERLKNLQSLLLSTCPFLQTLPNLTNSKNLQCIIIGNCPELVEIEGLEKLESLKWLFIFSCSSLHSLPDLSHLKKLESYRRQ
ncbi:hypothetical protein BT93_C1003 [Corymbia citriodora subsp. variegata]|nr:hypothetical protein BT93_C1003 [Corymbia citriodora subsp. variegata]